MQKRYTLHSQLATHYSEPLGVLLNGPMSEAKQGSAVLDDVDEDTFARFCQYLYTGDYDYAEDADDPATIAISGGIEAERVTQGTSWCLDRVGSRGQKKK